MLGSPPASQFDFLVVVTPAYCLLVHSIFVHCTIRHTDSTRKIDTRIAVRRVVAFSDWTFQFDHFTTIGLIFVNRHLLKISGMGQHASHPIP